MTIDSKIEITEKQNLASFTSWQVGGEADFYCAPQSIDQLKQGIKIADNNQWPVTLLGGGTNVLISDQGVRGLVIHTIHLNQVEVEESGSELIITAECGAQKSDVLKYFLKHRLQPAVFLAGLPGDVAGGVVMNAGVSTDTQPKEFCEIVKDFEVLKVDSQGEIIAETFDANDVLWAYRKSTNWQPGVISKVRLSWPNQPDDTVLEKVRAGNKRRKQTQPLHQPSCGSVFKNPTGDYSGRLIESAGLKGFCIGQAQVSEKHGNFIVNLGGAKAQDLHDLIIHVQKSVEDKFNTKLTNEVVYLGDWNS